MSNKRQGAHARKLPKEVDNSLFSFIPKEKRKTAGVIAIIAIVVIVALVWMFSWGILSFDGRLPYYGGKVHAEEDTLVLNVGTSSSPKYKSAGKFPGTDRYTLDPDYSVGTDKNKTEWTYRSVQADPIYEMFVIGSNGSYEAVYDNMLQSFSLQDEEGNYVFNGTEYDGVNANGVKWKGFTSDVLEMPDYNLIYYYMLYQGFDYTDYYEQRAYAFFETGEDACTVVILQSKADTEAELPGAEALSERLNEFKDLIYADAEDGTEPVVVNITSDEETTTKTVGYFAPTDKYYLDTESDISGWKYDGVRADPIYFMYVSGVNNTMEGAYESSKSYYSTTDEDENTVFPGTEKEGTNAHGLKYKWLASAAQSVTNYELYSKYGLTVVDYYAKYTTAYIETAKDRCVLVGVYGKADTVEGLPTDEELFARAQEFIDLVDKP